MNDHPILLTWAGFGISLTLTQVNAILSAISFVVVIGFTLHRWYFLWKNRGK